MPKFLLMLLTLILAVTAFWQLIIFPAVQDPLLSPMIKLEIKGHSGELALLAQDLNQFAIEDREQALADIQQHYGFSLTLIDINNLPIDSDELKQLRQGEAVATIEDELRLHYLLDDGETVVSLLDPRLPAKHLMSEFERISMGGFWLVETRLLSQPEDQWTEVLDDIAKHFDFPVSMLSLETLELAATDFEKLQSGRIVSFVEEATISAVSVFYKRIGDSQYVIKAGPVDSQSQPVTVLFLCLYYALMAMIILLPLIIWLLPTARSMSRLHKATQAFGRGEFNARATSYRFSHIKELSIAFNAMAEKIQTLFDSHKLLTTAVSHDLRTPLSRLEFAIELLRSSNDEHQREKQLSRMEGAVEELNNLVAEMLLFARFDREKPRFNLELVDIKYWLTSEAEHWRQGKKCVIVECYCDDQLRAHIDRYYMGRVLNNLLRNAVQYCRKRVSVYFDVKGRYCFLSVEDDGYGIAVDDRERVFEPFVRLEESRNRSSGGTGLGLAIVRQIVLWQGGSISVQSSPLGGAKFVLSWPLDTGNITE